MGGRPPSSRTSRAFPSSRGSDAQFPQKLEYAADEYGFKFCVGHGFIPYGMARSLEKLVELSQGAKASTVQKMFSSHPDSEKRAARVRKMAEEYEAAHPSTEE